MTATKRRTYIALTQCVACQSTHNAHINTHMCARVGDGITAGIWNVDAVGVLMGDAADGRHGPYGRS